MAQNLKFAGQLNIINIRNAMQQVIHPYRLLLIACASALRYTETLKQVVELVLEQEKNFKQLNQSTTIRKKVLTLDKAIRERFGNSIYNRTHCHACKEIGHFKVECPRNIKKNINLVNEVEIFEEESSDEGEEYEQGNGQAAV